MDGDQVRVWTEDTGDADDGAAVQIDVRIARGVRWDAVVGNGAKQIRFALGSGAVNSVELRGGVGRAIVETPRSTRGSRPGAPSTASAPSRWTAPTPDQRGSASRARAKLVWVTRPLMYPPRIAARAATAFSGP